MPGARLDGRFPLCPWLGGGTHGGPLRDNIARFADYDSTPRPPRCAPSGRFPGKPFTPAALAVHRNRSSTMEEVRRDLASSLTVLEAGWLLEPYGDLSGPASAPRPNPVVDAGATAWSADRLARGGAASRSTSVTYLRSRRSAPDDEASWAIDCVALRERRAQNESVISPTAGCSAREGVPWLFPLLPTGGMSCSFPGA